MTPDEIAKHAQKNPGQGPYHLHRAEGKDLLEAAVLAVEKAAYWIQPQNYHKGMYEQALQMATLRANIALAVEMRALRKAMEQKEDTT